MAVSVSNEYKQVIYSQQARNKLKLLFNNVELQDADRYCEKLTVKSRIIPNGAKIFSLNNFISKEADLILHDIDTSIIQNQVSISIGTLVGNSYEYVPIGIFNIENQPTNDKNKTTIKLRDNSVKFDFNYNAQPLIEQNGGVATKLQILQDICSQAGVTCNITSFVGYLDEIGVYDNTITAREYISRLAEQAGRIAIINRSGELIFVDLNNLTTWEIPIEIVEKYENGTKYKIGRVVYEDGIVRYETPTSNDDTLFLDGSNNYINGELVKEQASSNNNHYYLENTGDSELAYLKLEGKTTQATRSGKNLLKNTNVNSGDYNYWLQYSTFDEATRTITKSTTTTTESFISHRLNGLKSNTAYTLSLYAKSNGYVKSMDLFCYNQNTQGIKSKGNLTLTTDFQKYTFTFTTASDVTYGAKSVIRIDNNGSTASGTEAILTVKDVMLAEGTDTEYEDYGISPSPDYPSELVSVGYENLYSIENNSSNINVDGQGTLRYGQIIDTNGNNVVVYCENKNNSTTYVRKVTNNVYSGTSVVSETPISFNNADKIIIFSSSKTEIEKLQNVIITKGNKAHSYIPYGKYGIEVKTNGKNLFDESQLLNATDWALNDDGYYYGLRGNLYNKYKEANGGFLFEHNFKENTQYTISFIAYCDSGSGNARFEIKYTDGTIQSSGNWNTTTPIAITKTSLANKTIASISYNYGAGGDKIDYFKNIQLEKGTQATSYEPYIGHTNLISLDNPLRSIGNIKDLLYIKNGMLYVERKIGSVVLDGSEDNWNTEGDNAYIAITDVKGNNTKSLSNNFIYTTTANNLWGYMKFGNINNNLIFYKAIVEKSSLTGFKSWLSTHNTEVQYELAEPYTEELGQVDMPSTYGEITYIDISSNINTNSYLQYRQNKTQLEAILQNTNQFSIDSLKTGKILGNPAIDSYDLIQITDGNKIFKTLATNDLVYTGVLINTFDTQIGEEAKEQNVFINGEETFKKWARTTIDNVEGTLTLQAGQIDEANGKINETNLIIEKDGALLNVLANNSNIDVQYDSEGNPLSGEVREVTTTTGFKFNAEGMTIEDTSSNFKAQHRNTGTYYKDGDTIVGQYTKDGSKQKDLDLFGVYTYGKNDIDDTPMFIAQLYTDANGEECFGHFYNRGD